MRVCYCRFAERDFDEECLFSERCLVFLKFLNFASLLSFFWREMGLRHRSTRTQHSSIKIKIHPFVCPPSRCSFGHFPFVLLGISAQKRKRIYQNDLLLLSLVRARDKNAPLFDEMMRTTTTEKASLCVSCFSSLQRKKKTKKEVGLRVSLRSYAVSCNVILLSRFLSLSFSVSLSLWNDGTDF